MLNKFLLLFGQRGPVLGWGSKEQSGKLDNLVGPLLGTHSRLSSSQVCSPLSSGALLPRLGPYTTYGPATLPF